MNFFATKTNIVAIEVEKITRRMLRQNKELKEEISVATKEDYVATVKFVE